MEIINFPPKIKKLTIGENAFSCTRKNFANKIKEIDLSGCVNLAKLKILKEAFHDCSALETVNFEGSVINIGNKAFPAQQWLMNVIINANFIGLIVMAIATIVSGVISSSFLQALYFGLLFSKSEIISSSIPAINFQNSVLKSTLKVLYYQLEYLF